jgi:hypothetical protein
MRIDLLLDSSVSEQSFGKLAFAQAGTFVDEDSQRISLCDHRVPPVAVCGQT